MLNRILTPAAPAKAQNFDLLMAAIPDLILHCDFQGQCLRVLPTRGAAAGADPELYTPGVFFERGGDVADAIRQAARSGQGVTLEGRRASGGAWYSVSLSPLEDGTVLLAARDITEQKRTLAAMAQSRDELVRRLAESMGQVGQTNERLTTQIQELEQRNRAIEVMGQMASLLQACNKTGEAHGIVVRFMQSLFPSSTGMLAMIKDSRNMVEAEAVWGEGAEEQFAPVFEPAACWGLRSGKMHDSAAGPVCEHLARSRMAGSQCVPMLAQGESLGVLHVSLTERFSDAQKNLLLAAAEQIALALANLRLRAVLNDLSVRDALTGVHNRRYLEEALDRELSRARRTQTSLGVIMFDVDHFKKFNDTWGHEAGDRLLHALGEMVSGYVREEDIACRYGGEEFTVILPGTSLEIALRRAEELRILVRNNLRLSVSGLGGQPATTGVSLSLGVAVYPDHARDKAALLRLADGALYQAKKAGRDRVVVAGQGAEVTQSEAA